MVRPPHCGEPRFDGPRDENNDARICEKWRAGVEREQQGTLPTPHGRDLMVLVGGGDADAFAALYDRHCRSAYTRLPAE